MATDYHLHPTGSIPGRDEITSLCLHWGQSPLGGQWSDHIPLSAISSCPRTRMERRLPNFLGMIQRLLTTRAVTRFHRLPLVQAAINEIQYRYRLCRRPAGSLLPFALPARYTNRPFRPRQTSLHSLTFLICRATHTERPSIPLPVKQVPSHRLTPVTKSGHFSFRSSQPRSISPQFTLTSVTKSNLKDILQQHTPDRKSDSGYSAPVIKSGIEPNPGQKDHLSPDRESDITRTKRSQRITIILSSLLLVISIRGHIVRALRTRASLTPSGVGAFLQMCLRTRPAGASHSCRWRYGTRALDRSCQVMREVGTGGFNSTDASLSTTMWRRATPSHRNRRRGGCHHLDQGAISASKSTAAHYTG